MVRDPFEGDTSSFSDDYSGTIVDLTFMPGEYGVQAIFKTKLDTPTPKNDGTLRTEAPNFLKLPDGWSDVDGVLTHDTRDPDKRLDARNQFQKVIARAAEIGARDAIMAGGGPYVAAAWVGLRFHWMTEEAGKDYSFTDKTTGEKRSGKTKGVVMPVEFLGTTANPVAGNTNNPNTNGFGDYDPETLNLPDDVMEALKGLAPTLTYGKFVVEALHFKDADGCASLNGALGNKDLYHALGGVEA